MLGLARVVKQWSNLGCTRISLIVQSFTKKLVYVVMIGSDIFLEVLPPKLVSNKRLGDFEIFFGS